MARTITDPAQAASLARVIASDLSLYHEAELVEGLRRGQPFAGLEDALVEARALVLERVPPALDPLGLLVRVLAEFFERWADERGLPSTAIEPALAEAILPLALQARAGLEPGGTIPLVDGTLVIGRGAGADLQIDLSTLDPRHARLTIAGSRVEVEDLASALGTYVNGDRVTAPTRLAVGDALQVGTVVLEVVRG